MLAEIVLEEMLGTEARSKGGNSNPRERKTGGFYADKKSAKSTAG